nr:MAG TPA: hypothetical protein [Caudoviricetes sp.]
MFINLYMETDRVARMLANTFFKYTHIKGDYYAKDKIFR